MKNLLRLLGAREAELLAALPKGGYFEERAPLIEKADLPRRWVQVVQGYVELLDDAPYRLEALRRAVFLIWYSWNEPPALTGIGETSHELEVAVLQALEAELQSPEPDLELCSMMSGYGRGLPFERYPQFTATKAFLKTATGSCYPTVPMADLDSRGAMGAYWLSRNDLPNRPLQLPGAAERPEQD